MAGPMRAPGTGGPGRGHNFREKEKPKDLKATLKKLSRYIGYNKKLFISSIVVILIVTGLNLLTPIFQSEALGAITLDENNTINKDRFHTFLLLMLVAYILVACFSFFQNYIAARLSQETVRKMRNDLFSKFTRLPIKFIDTHSHGDLMSRMTNDVENVSNTISQSIASLVSGIVTILGTLTIMIVKSWSLTLITLGSTVLTLLASSLIMKKMTPLFRRRSQELGQLNGHAEEMITGYKTVAAYSKEEDVLEEFSTLSNKLTKTTIVGEIWGGSMGPIMNGIGNLTYLAIAIIGSYIILNNPSFIVTFSKDVVTRDVAIATLAYFLTAAKQFSRPINEIANLFGQVINAMAGAERVFEVIDSDNEVDEGTKEINLDTFEGHIEFKNVNFSYVEGQRVLKNFSLKVDPGEKIALVGHTGSGKTTIVNLLMRFYDVDDGEILIDGVNINEIKKESLRNTISIVLQDTVLFIDTIASNIKYGKLDASFEEMKNAAILANVNFFVKKLPERYDTMLTESGSNLSQGQRQLLSISRAVLKDPKILILDEATSSVDTRTEKNIQDAMVNLMKNRTNLIIAHRLSTIQDADKIVVIDHGEILEIGNHYELLEKQGKYYDLYMTQFAGKEI